MHTYASWYCPEHALKTDMEERTLFNKSFCLARENIWSTAGLILVPVCRAAERFAIVAPCSFAFLLNLYLTFTLCCLK